LLLIKIFKAFANGAVLLAQIKLLRVSSELC